MDVTELGELLRKERERQGMSLEDVAEKSKISRRNLEALEQGNAKLLPHPVYAKGFVKSYCQIVGIEGEEMESLLTCSYFGRTVDPEPVLGRGQQDCKQVISSADEARIKRPVFSLLAAGVLLAILVGLVLSLDFGPILPTSSTGVEEASLSTPAPNREPSSAHDNAAAVAEDIVPDEEVPDQPVAASPKKLAQTSEAHASVPEDSQRPMDQAISERTTPSAAVEPAPEPEDKLKPQETLRIVADEPCWLRYSIDGNRREDVYLETGEEIELVYEQKVKVRLGNAGGVRLALNGDPYPLEAESGEIAVLAFP